MPTWSARRLVAVALGTLVALATSGCVSSGGGGGSGSGAAQPTGNAWAAATSAAAGGGMDALVAAAKQEGQLNVIALPPDWANYGAIIDGFKAKYGITVNSANPEGSSQDEINAVQQLGTQDRAPDVLDLGQSFANKNVALFAPYQVATWDSIPAGNKDPNGTWVNDYGGFISIGCNASLVTTCPKTLADLAKPEYQGKVALNGDPTQAGAAFSGVLMVALSQGGSVDDVAPGVEFFRKLKAAGNLLPVDPTPATVESGQTPVVIDWNYLNAAETAKLPAWQIVVPPNAVVAGYYYQAINKDAPHPAAARLWQEFLYSDEGQNLFAAGGVRPVRADQMMLAGTIDKAAVDKIQVIDGPVTVPSPDQTDKATEFLADNWAKAIG